MKTRFFYAVLAVSFILIQGCAPSQYMVRDPNLSQFQYSDDQAMTEKRSLEIVDNRAELEKVFHSGVLKASLVNGGSEIDSIAYLKVHTVNELQARGIAMDQLAGDRVEVSVNKLNMRNHRTNGFTPFITFTSLSADVNTPLGQQRIAVYIKRGKVPVWSFDEVVEPTLNQPLELLVKEFSSKLNLALFNRRASDRHVQELIDKISAGNAAGTTYLDVYELGFSNNDNAIDYLASLTSHSDENVRLAAISSLGNMRAVDQLPLLKSIYETADSWSDRGMALKAIGDIGSGEAIGYLQQVLAKQSGSGKESDWNRDIIQLYL